LKTRIELISTDIEILFREESCEDKRASTLNLMIELREYRYSSHVEIYNTTDQLWSTTVLQALSLMIINKPDAPVEARIKIQATCRNKHKTIF